MILNDPTDQAIRAELHAVLTDAGVSADDMPRVLNAIARAQADAFERGAHERSLVYSGPVIKQPYVVDEKVPIDRTVIRDVAKLYGWRVADSRPDHSYVGGHFPVPGNIVEAYAKKAETVWVHYTPFGTIRGAELNFAEYEGGDLVARVVDFLQHA